LTRLVHHHPTYEGVSLFVRNYRTLLRKPILKKRGEMCRPQNGRHQKRKNNEQKINDVQDLRPIDIGEKDGR
jgi:hypothetical protein